MGQMTRSQPYFAVFLAQLTQRTDHIGVNKAMPSWINHHLPISLSKYGISFDSSFTWIKPNMYLEHCVRLDCSSGERNWKKTPQNVGMAGLHKQE